MALVSSIYRQSPSPIVYEPEYVVRKRVTTVLDRVAKQIGWTEVRARIRACEAPEELKARLLFLSSGY